MTGPRMLTVHPHRRRGRLLLPFAVAVALVSQGCNGDQATGPASSSQPSASIARGHPYPLRLEVQASAGSINPAAAQALSMNVSGSVSGTGPKVLVLADVDGASTTALADTLTEAGFQVTLRPAPEYTWDGTNPSLGEFHVVLHLNGGTFSDGLASGAQAALNSFVQNGGGFVGAQWNGYELALFRQVDMPDLVLLGLGGRMDTPEETYPEKNCGFCQITYEAVAGQESHPVLAGLPSSFTFMADAHDAGPAIDFTTDPSTVLMRVPSGGPAVLVRQFAAGRVVNFSFAPNYPYDDLGEVHELVTLQDSKIKRLYVNAVRWAAGSAGGGGPAPQTITFAPLADKVYGDPAFSVSASASSGLTVSFTAAGSCNVAGSTVTTTSSGTCTITAHQAGDANYLPADDVARSFQIAKATATMTVGTEYVFDGTVKAAVVTTNPAGLTGVSVAYSQGGSPVTSPINAGSYLVVATLDNPNYEAIPATGTLTILQATPAIDWTPASLSAGTPLGAAQLNATASGVGSVALAGNFVYDPPAGTMLSAGPASLSVHFMPSDPNYAGADKTVSINVAGALTFSGFFAPIRNLPAVNAVRAGSAVPMKFSLGGYRGLQVLSPGSPTSVAVACGSAPANTVQLGTTFAPSGLHALGYTYTYVWKTDPAWGGTCRKFVLTLTDGTTHEALFQFMPEPKRVTASRRILQILRSIR